MFSVITTEDVTLLPCLIFNVAIVTLALRYDEQILGEKQRFLLNKKGCRPLVWCYGQLRQIQKARVILPVLGCWCKLTANEPC